MRIAHIVPVYDPGAQGRRGVAALDAQIWTVIILQVVPDCVIVAQRVAPHMVHGLLSFHLAGCLADDRDQLRLIVHVVHAAGSERCLLVSDEGVCRLQKDQGLRRRFERQFGRMVGVVQTQSNHSAMFWRQPCHLVFRQGLAIRRDDAVVIIHDHLSNPVAEFHSRPFH